MWISLWDFIASLVLGLYGASFTAYEAIKFRFGSDDGYETRKWLKQYLLRVPEDFAESWRDGILLSNLLNKLKPGCYPDAKQLDINYGLRNLYRAFHILETEFNIIPKVTVEEVLTCCDGSDLKLLSLLLQLKQKVEDKEIVPSTSNENTLSALTSGVNSCTAKGAGLVEGFVGYPANFMVDYASISSLDVLVEIKGPQNTYCSERVTKRSPKKKTLLKPWKSVSSHDLPRSSSNPEDKSAMEDQSIEQGTDGNRMSLEYEIQINRINFTYTPLFQGYHKIQVISRGQYVLGSPFTAMIEQYDKSSKKDDTSGAKDSSTVEEFPIVPQEAKVPEPKFQKTAERKENLGKILKRRVLRYVVKIDNKDIVVEADNIGSLATSLLKMDYDIQKVPVGRRNSWGFVGDAERKVSVIRQFCVNPEELEAQSVKLHRSHSLSLNSNKKPLERTNVNSYECEDISLQSQFEYLPFQRKREDAYARKKLETVSEEPFPNSKFVSSLNDRKALAYLDEEFDRELAYPKSEEEVIFDRKAKNEKEDINLREQKMSGNSSEEDVPMELSPRLRRSGQILSNGVVPNLKRFDFEADITSKEPEALNEDSFQEIETLTPHNNLVGDIFLTHHEGQTKGIQDENVKEAKCQDKRRKSEYSENPKSINPPDECVEEVFFTQAEEKLLRTFHPSNREVFAFNTTPEASLDGDGLQREIKNATSLMVTSKCPEQISSKSFSRSEGLNPFNNQNLMDGWNSNNVQRLKSNSTLNLTDKMKRSKKSIHAISERWKNNSRSFRRFNRSPHNNSLVFSHKLINSKTVNNGSDNFQGFYSHCAEQNIEKSGSNCFIRKNEGNFPNTKSFEICSDKKLQNKAYSKPQTIYQENERNKVINLSLGVENSSKNSHVKNYNLLSKINNHGTNDKQKHKQESTTYSVQRHYQNKNSGTETCKLSAPNAVESENISEKSCVGVANENFRNSQVETTKLSSHVQFNYKHFNLPLSCDVSSRVRSQVQLWENKVKKVPNSMPDIHLKKGAEFDVRDCINGLGTKLRFWESAHRTEQNRSCNSKIGFRDDRNTEEKVKQNREDIHTDKSRALSPTHSHIALLSDINDDEFEQNLETTKKKETEPKIPPSLAVSRDRSHSEPCFLDFTATEDSTYDLENLESELLKASTSESRTADELISSQTSSLPSSYDANFYDEESDEELMKYDVLHSTEDEYIDDEISESTSTYWGDISLQKWSKVAVPSELEDFCRALDPEYFKGHSFQPCLPECKVFGIAMYFGYVAVKNRFKVLVKGAPHGNLSASVQGFGLHDVSFVGVEYIKKDIYEITYQVMTPGLYLISVRWMEVPLSGSPFLCKVTF